MPERPPLDPVWQTYIIQAHGTGSPPPCQATAGSPLGSLAHQSAPAQRSPAAAAHSPPSSRSPAYQPTTQLSSTELELQGARGTYDHFHAPWNQHNKFLASARASDRAAYRDVPRMPPPPFDKSGRSSMRPASAPRPRTAGSSSPGHPAPRPLGAAPTSLLDNMVTFTGAPCYTVSALIEADLQEGCPVAGPLTPSHKGSPASQAGPPHELGSSRVARVLTYAVPPSGLGYGEGGVRPFHQDYRHYKYFGFAGRGAKTSWAHNPKYAQQHLHEREGGSPSPTANRSLVTNRPGSARPAPRSPLPTEILEPYKQHVSIATAAPLSPAEARDRQRTDRALVTTYRQPAPSDLMLAENPSPHCGSQSPFHQRYKHYKYHGFAGRGASSSWARNPKLALLYDH